MALEAIAALRSGATDAATLTEQANALGGVIEFWLALDTRIFVPFYLTTIGALCAAAGDLDGARQRYTESLQLAAQTGMRFYDAETARRLAHLETDRETRITALGAALFLARSQAARPFELRIALDLHDLVGEESRSSLEQAMAAFGADVRSLDIEEARARVMTRR
jgi:hypothetical protein